jgi:NAD(P)H dehydrogenase (quinone)
MGLRVLVVLASARTVGLGQHLAEFVRSFLVRAGAEVVVQDLLQDGFDPVLRMAPGQPHALAPDPESDPLAARYVTELQGCDVIVIVHPVWWFQAPAILKGWVDRIFVHGVAIEHQQSGPPRGLLTHKELLVLQTFNSSARIDRILFRGVSTYFWKRIVGLPTGLRRVRRLALYGVDDLPDERLRRFQERVQRALSALV